MGNLTAGIGDPYWYEWSVGLLNIIKMLNPDNNIKNVVLQSDESQCLDDVVVTFNDGTVQNIQVKHTRQNDTLTFSDLIQGKKEESFLYRFSAEWIDKQKQGNADNRVIVFTNRRMGNRKYTPTEQWERPPLDLFWSEIKKQAKDLDNKNDINDISVKKDWEEAWNTFKAYMPKLNAKEQLQFLQRFELMTDQSDLEEIINDIANELTVFFDVSHEKAVSLHQKLCYALMKWSTSISDKREIEKEDVMEALSLANDSEDTYKKHDLLTCEPFFQSRVDFVKKLEQTILKDNIKVLFLTGNPGSGKTNIISYMSRKPESIVTLRFHTFKPIMPGELYLSADAGISEPRAFWGGLLAMLRPLFCGRLYKYRVPISTEFIDSIDKLRSEVLRLASDLAKLTGNPTIIAVDGIDHAARSGCENTFLSTLLPPEAIPDNVKFILAGQPVYMFPEYPDFLNDEEMVETIDMPAIDKSDLYLLFDYKKQDFKYNDHDKKMLIDYISKSAGGNVLSAVFAVQEAFKYSNFDDFLQNSNVEKLSSGVQAYYEYIWKKAFESTSHGYTIDMYLTAIFSIINRKISAQTITDIFENEIPVYVWEELLQNLYPIIVYDQFGYSVFHNDVRIYLLNHLKRARLLLPDINEKIANYLLNVDFDKKLKHEIIFRLLKDANKQERYVDVFSTEYVMEAYSLRRNPKEIKQQMFSTLQILPEIKDQIKIIRFSCAVSTMYQHEQSLQWLDVPYEYEFEVPFALNSEIKFITEFLSIDDYQQAFRDINLLIKKQQYVRARRILERWMVNKTPGGLYNYLIQESEEEEVLNLIEIWGEYARKFEYAPEYEDDKTENAELVFCKGWLNEAVHHDGIDLLIYTFENIRFYRCLDMQEFLHNIIANDNREEIEWILTELDDDMFSVKNRLIACAWTLRNNCAELCKEWINDVVSKGFDYITEEFYKNNYLNIDQKREMSMYVADCLYILSYVTDQDEKTLINDALVKVGFEKMDDRYRAEILMINIFQIACIEKAVIEGGEICLGVYDFVRIIDCIFNDSKKLNNSFEINVYLFREKMLYSVLRIIEALPDEYVQAFNAHLCKKVKEYGDIGLFKIYTEYLISIGREDLVEKYYDFWMNPKGEIWREELSERMSIANILMKTATDLDWEDRIKESEDLLNARCIGYTGHKEYSLFNPLMWFRRVAGSKNELWKTLGCMIMNISEAASQLGDNRASIQIESSVAAIAGRSGPRDLLQFVKMVKLTNDRWDELLFDGIIAALETEIFTEQELLLIWTNAIKFFPISKHTSIYDMQNTRHKVYCTDIRKAICLCGKRLGYAQLDEQMRSKAPIAFNQTELNESDHACIVPERWYQSDYYDEVDDFINETKDVDLDEVFTKIKEIHNKSNSGWDYIRYFIERSQQQNPHLITKYKHEIMAMLREREMQPLEFDGCHRLYKVLFRYLTDDEVNEVLKNIIVTYENCIAKGWTSAEYSLMTDLEYFTFSLYSRMNVEDNIYALKEILNTHQLWLNGGIEGGLANIYVLGNEESAELKKLGWDAFWDALLQIERNDNKTYIE